MTHLLIFFQGWFAGTVCPSGTDVLAVLASNIFTDTTHEFPNNWKMLRSPVEWKQVILGSSLCPGGMSATKAISDLKHILHSTHTLLPNHKTFIKWTFEKYCNIILFTHWGRVTHIGVSKIAIICSDNGLSPGRRQAIIWTKAEILLIRTWGTNVYEILKEIYMFSFKKMHLNMSSGKWRPFRLGLIVVRTVTRDVRACNIRHRPPV